MGKYDIQNGIVEVIFENGKLYAKPPNGPKLQLLPFSESGYFIDQIDIQIIFNRKADGTGDKMVVHQGGQERDCKKIE